MSKPELIERAYWELPFNGVRVPYVCVSRYRYNDKWIEVSESLFTCFMSGECGLRRQWRVAIRVKSIASARKIARDLGYVGEVETFIAGYEYGIRW